MGKLWLRGEVNEKEQRVPITPDDASQLTSLGIDVHVEVSSNRVFADDAYQNAGCRLEPTGSWRDARSGTLVLGIKLPQFDGKPIEADHLFFAHQYTRTRILAEKPTALQMLGAFQEGGGRHYDIEFLSIDGCQCVTAFSRKSGSIGAALGVILYNLVKTDEKHAEPLFTVPSTLDTLCDLAVGRRDGIQLPSVAVLGTGGQCGRGASMMLKCMDIPFEAFGRQDLAKPDVTVTLSKFDVLINCMAVDESTPKILAAKDFHSNAKLSVIADIGCETNDNNPILLRDDLTSIDAPYYVREAGGNSVHIIAIDHLPTITPLESSIEFSRELAPLLIDYLTADKVPPAWSSAYAVFAEALEHSSPEGQLHR